MTKHISRDSYLELIGPGKPFIRSDGSRRSTVIVKCACGNIKTINADTLSKIKSCGCKWLELHKLPVGQAAMNHYFLWYVDSARVRGYPFQLTINEFIDLVLQPCFYCNAEPYRTIPAAKRYNGSRLVSEVDRVDNTKGYTLNNCVPCCTKCNCKKGAVTVDITKKILEFCKL